MNRWVLVPMMGSIVMLIAVVMSFLVTPYIIAVPLVAP